MATQTVTISLDPTTGKPVVDKNPVSVYPADTIVWALSPTTSLSWPPNFTPASIISYLNETGYIVLVNPDSLAFGDPIPPSTTPTIRGQVKNGVIAGSKELYNVYVSQVVNGLQEVILGTHDYDDDDDFDDVDGIEPIDPKIQIKS